MAIVRAHPVAAGRMLCLRKRFFRIVFFVCKCPVLCVRCASLGHCSIVFSPLIYRVCSIVCSASIPMVFAIVCSAPSLWFLPLSVCRVSLWFSPLCACYSRTLRSAFSKLTSLVGVSNTCALPIGTVQCILVSGVATLSIQIAPLSRFLAIKTNI